LKDVSVQGPVENALMIVCAGNIYLQGGDIDGFWPDAQTFRYLELCEFRLRPESGKDDDEHPLLAADPMAWFASLKPWCRALRLHAITRERQPNQQTDAPDRMLAAFVGGGPRWIIEAVGETRSQLWEGYHRIGDQKAKDSRIWRCTHLPCGEANPDEVTGPNILLAMTELKKVLTEIEAYAREQNLDNFADCFASALKAAKADEIEDYPWAAEVIRWTGFNKMQLCWLIAIQHASVFGGMGSWNDVGLTGDPRYDQLSERLYTLLNACTTGLANSTSPVFLSYM
jgi:hypothetical protein